MDELISIFKKHIKNGLYPGIEWKITHKEKIYKGTVGNLNLTSKEPLQPNSLYRIWSMTKPIVCIAILQLIQENKISIDDPINQYLPDFSNLKAIKDLNSNIFEVVDLKEMPTIKNLLLHTAGFSYNFLGDPVAKEYERVKLFHSSETTLEEEIHLLSKIPLLYQPSVKWIYSVSVDVLARIIEIVSQNYLPTVLYNRIFKPLKMFDTGFNINNEDSARLMTSYEFDQLNNKLNEPLVGAQKISGYGYPLNSLSYARGGHGLYSTVEDYSKFSQMLLNGKSKSGNIIISQKMLEIATSNHLDKSFFPLEILSFDNINNDDQENDLESYGWGLGFRVMQDLDKVNGIGSVGEFGWAGAAGTFFLVDPKNDLTAVVMTQVLNADPIMKKDFINTIYKNIL